MRPHPVNIVQWVPWRVRHAAGRAWRSAGHLWWKGLNALGLASLRDTDRVRNWPLPHPDLYERGEQTFRPIFRAQDYNSEFIQELRRSVQRCAQATGTTLDPSKRWEIPVLLAGSGIQADHICLDVGCGSSCLPVWLNGIGAEVFAVDPEMGAVSNTWTLPTSRIHVNGDFINYVRRSVTDLPFKDEMFDHVFCVSVIEHLPPALIPRAIREMIRVTRRGGTVALSTDVYPLAQARIHKNHAQIFDLDGLRGQLLPLLEDLQPVFPLDLVIAEGLDQHLRDLKTAFNTRHSFFADVWCKLKPDSD